MLRPGDNLQLTNNLSPRGEGRCDGRIILQDWLTCIRRPLQFFVGKDKGYLVFLIELETCWLFVNHWSEGNRNILRLTSYVRTLIVPDQLFEFTRTSA